MDKFVSRNSGLDIFGNRPQNYSHYHSQIKQGPEAFHAFLNHRAKESAMADHKPHDFHALEHQLSTAASDDAQVMGYITDNLQAMDAMVQRVLYDSYRLPEWVPIRGNIPEGATTVAMLIFDGVGSGQFIEESGSEINTSSVGFRKVQYPIYYGAAGARWSMEAARQALYAGVPLESALLEHAARGALTHMETVGLLGDTRRGLTGLINQSTTGTGAVSLTTASKTFAASTADEMIAVLQGAMRNIITSNNGILVNRIPSELMIFLPYEQFLRLSDIPRSQDNDKSVRQFFEENNAWSAFTGRRPMFVPIAELKEAGASDTDRMVIAMKNENIYQMAIPIQPRVTSVVQVDAVNFHVAIEYRMSGVHILRPDGIYYIDGV